SMAANAVLKLLTTYNIKPETIGRLYIGTESGLDGAKPLATYVLEMLNQHYNDQHKTNKQFFGNCDALDMTFACIGGVDALQNTLDWVRSGENRLGIVVATDYAKYDKLSGGEYTQGAGAVAMLVKQQPRLLVINDTWGVATQSEHDFFKPKFSETPVFDGQFSNNCYQQRLQSAYQHFKQQKIALGDYQSTDLPSEKWSQIIFHLPYAFHGKRMFTEIFTEERKQAPHYQFFSQQLGLSPETFASTNLNELTKIVAKSNYYNEFVQQKIADGQTASSSIGNMYTASIFMALMSSLALKFGRGEDLTQQTIGFCAYGSGSKSKVFEGVIQPNYREIVDKFALFEQLNQRQAITVQTYEQLHDKTLRQSISSPTGKFILQAILNEPVTLAGARKYTFE
ncbi:MAG: hydroxymethylglutaryl-CoA synthase family protein, partial [Thermoflexibacteraceae bacterium]